MDKAYQGKRDDGTWEQFNASSPDEATPEATGYSEVEEITDESTIPYNPQKCKCPIGYHKLFENCRGY